MQEAAERATEDRQEREAALVQTFKDKGVNVTEVDKATFEDAVLENKPVTSLGFDQADWEAIQAIQSGS